MMATIWVVERGEYSDYRVVGVFTSREHATLVAEVINTGDEHSPASVAEWPLDPAIAELQQGHRQYLVRMLRDGTVEKCAPWEISGYGLSGGVSIWRRSTAPAYIGRGIPDCLEATAWARDEPHAIKIANEKRVQLIAAGSWVE